MEFELVVQAVSPRKLKELHRRDDEAVVMESPLQWHPGEHCEIGSRRGPKARYVDFNGQIRIHSVDAHCLDLQSHNATVRQMSDGELHGLRVWKWPEQV